MDSLDAHTKMVSLHVTLHNQLVVVVVDDCWFIIIIIGVELFAIESRVSMPTV